MTMVQVLLLVNGVLAGALLVYDDTAWSVATGIVQVVVCLFGFVFLMSATAGLLGYLAGLALG